jgi:hypothetical protein
LALRSEFSFGHSAFDDFLFASVGEEKNGIELTVLSALTRLGFDPWVEAARLSDMPAAAAGHTLAATIAVLPEGEWKVTDSEAIAARLVDRLPRRDGPVVQSPWGSGKNQKKELTAIMWPICIALAAALLFAAFNQYAGHVFSDPEPSLVSSTRT